MKKVKITVLRKADYKDLQQIYENKTSHACDLSLGDTFIYEGTKPDGLCESAFQTMRYFLEELSKGNGNFYDGWMKNKNSALISCNDGFRPVSFLIESLEE